jgi:phosphatidate cytidylyltransferase
MELLLGIKHLSSLQQRVLTALVVAPLCITTIYLGSPYFDLLAGFILFAMIREWSKMVLGKGGAYNPIGYVLTALMLSLMYADLGYKKYILCSSILTICGGLFHMAIKKRLFDYVVFILGTLYISWSTYILIQLEHEDLTLFFLWILLIIWSSDIGAYFAGKYIGGPKLAPTISPNKTWAGFIGGCLAATVTGILTGATLQSFYQTPLCMAVVALLLSIVSHLGDLLESFLKRYYGVKDTGTLLPGHGGILDRLDSLLLVSFAAGLLLIIGY